MPSLWQEPARRSLAERLARLTPGTAARWGRMSCPQMLAHINDGLRMAMGELAAKPRPGPLRYPPLKQFVIYLAPFFRFLAGPALLLVSLAAGAPRPDFSGEWTLNKERSKLQLRQAAGIERAVVRIAHREPLFRFHRSFTVGGQEDTLSYELTTDGTEVTSVEGGQRTFSRLDWDGETLVFTTRIVAPRGEATNTVRYSLLDGGRTLQADERFRGPRLSYDNLWVFEKLSEKPK